MYEVRSYKDGVLLIGRYETEWAANSHAAMAIRYGEVNVSIYAY